MFKNSIFLSLLFFINVSQAQLGLCNGNSGDPIFTETFGSGIINTPLPSGTTTFSYIDIDPFDGEYTVSNTSGYFDWHNVEDHTPNDNNGRMMIVNADFQPGEFYRTTVNGLCEQTTYEFSAWLINLLPSTGCGGNGISINVQYEIWDITDTILLAIGATGNIENTARPIWLQYALLFQTEVDQSSVILKIKNFGVGGCGNDLALDDIVFKTCGDSIMIEDIETNNSVTICEDETPYSTEIRAIPDATVFSSHFYQWQQSTDGITWTNIIGENNANYNTPPLNTTIFYRVLVAENDSNINNKFCNSSSDIFEIRVVSAPNAPVTGGNLNICENDQTPLSVTVPSGISVNWYDKPIGGNLIQPNSTTFNPNGIAGTYYAEAITNIGNCESSTRTDINIIYNQMPQVIDETLKLCENTEITLNANSNIPNASYQWNNGEKTKEISVTSPGIYTVDISDNNCTVTKTITLNEVKNPIIEKVYSDGKKIIVLTSNEGDFQYSLNGNSFQFTNVFSNIDGGLYTVYVKEQNCKEIVVTEFLHFHIPKYFTPNNDGSNDVFDLKGIEFFNTSYVSIFNRYGKLLKSTKNSPFFWDGTFSGEPLPSDDYWYIIIVDNEKFMGHFTLKR